MTHLVERLLSRCVHEAEVESRTVLAQCMGEVGAISENRLGEIKVSADLGDNLIDDSNGSYVWRLTRPPWHSPVAKYELQLVTKLLVGVLKAAPSSADQHKIAFAIQQLLVLLDETHRGGRKSKMAEMSGWLQDHLRKHEVYDVVEPFWLSEFSEKVSAKMHSRMFSIIVSNQIPSSNPM